jgi:hypothetical protein
VALFYVAWFAWGVLALTVSALIVPRAIHRLGRLADVLFTAKFTIRKREETEWGALFDIVSPKGEVVGFDRYAVAKARCDQLNSSGTQL